MRKMITISAIILIIIGGIIVALQNLNIVDMFEKIHEQ